MDQNTKIAIISHNNYLKDSLSFNSDLVNIETFTPTEKFDLEKFSIIVGDTIHQDNDVKEVTKLFIAPIELAAVLKYIADQLEQKASYRVSERKRILYIDKHSIPLTEQEVEIMSHLINSSNMPLPKKALTDFHAFEAIKSIVYRLNSKLQEYDAPISLRINSKEILLKNN